MEYGVFRDRTGACLPVCGVRWLLLFRGGRWSLFYIRQTTVVIALRLRVTVTMHGLKLLVVIKAIS